MRMAMLFSLIKLIYEPRPFLPHIRAPRQYPVLHSSPALLPTCSRTQAYSIHHISTC